MSQYKIKQSPVATTRMYVYKRVYLFFWKEIGTFSGYGVTDWDALEEAKQLVKLQNKLEIYFEA
jgi:hypothetical protein